MGEDKMATWALVIVLHAGSWTRDMATTTISGFSSEAACNAAKEKMHSELLDQRIQHRLVCIKVE